MPEIEFSPYKQLVYAQPRISSGESDAKNFLEFLDTNRSPNFDQKIISSNNQLKKREILQNSGLWREGGPLGKNKRKRKEKYLDLARELKTNKLWNIEVTVKAVVIGTLGTIPKRLAKELEDLEIREQVETIQIIELLRSARILRRVLETRGYWRSLKLQWKTISLRRCEKLRNNNNNNNSCLNFWDEAWWFLLLRGFGLLSSSLLLFSQRFGRYVLRTTELLRSVRIPRGALETWGDLLSLKL